MFLCNALPSGCESVLWLSSEMKLFERGQLSATLRFLSAIKDYFFFFFSSFFFSSLSAVSHLSLLIPFFYRFICWNKMAAVRGINGQLDESVANLLVTRRIGHEVATN